MHKLKENSTNIIQRDLWYDSLTTGRKMALWVEFKTEEGSAGEGASAVKIIERAYKKHLKNFKLEVVA